MTDHLYTIVLEYRGGTYISQQLANSTATAAIHWAESISEDDARVWKVDREERIESVQADRPIELQGTANVWCLSGTVNNKLALINIIRTAVDEN